MESDILLYIFVVDTLAMPQEIGVIVKVICVMCMSRAHLAAAPSVQCREMKERGRKWKPDTAVINSALWCQTTGQILNRTAAKTSSVCTRLLRNGSSNVQVPVVHGAPARFKAKARSV